MTDETPSIPILTKMEWTPRVERERLIEIYKNNFQAYCKHDPTKQSYTASILNGSAGKPSNNAL